MGGCDQGPQIQELEGPDVFGVQPTYWSRSIHNEHPQLMREAKKSAIWRKAFIVSSAMLAFRHAAARAKEPISRNGFSASRSHLGQSEFFGSRFDQDMSGVKKRSRRRLTESERKHASVLRKTGACKACRLAKRKVIRFTELVGCWSRSDVSSSAPTLSQERVAIGTRSMS